MLGELFRFGYAAAGHSILLHGSVLLLVLSLGTALLSLSRRRRNAQWPVALLSGSLVLAIPGLLEVALAHLARAPMRRDLIDALDTATVVLPISGAAWLFSFLALPVAAIAIFSCAGAERKGSRKAQGRAKRMLLAITVVYAGTASATVVYRFCFGATDSFVIQIARRELLTSAPFWLGMATALASFLASAAGLWEGWWERRVGSESAAPALVFAIVAVVAVASSELLANYREEPPLPPLSLGMTEACLVVVSAACFLVPSALLVLAGGIRRLAMPPDGTN